MSFHVHRVFPLIFDWSVWHNAKHLVAHYYLRSDWVQQDSLSTLCNNCEMYLSEGSPNTIHTSVSSANDDDIQSSGIKGRQVVVTCNISKQDD